MDLEFGLQCSGFSVEDLWFGFLGTSVVNLGFSSQGIGITFKASSLFYLNCLWGSAGFWLRKLVSRCRF